MIRSSSRMIELRPSSVQSRSGFQPLPGYYTSDRLALPALGWLSFEWGPMLATGNSTWIKSRCRFISLRRLAQVAPEPPNHDERQRKGRKTEQYNDGNHACLAGLGCLVEKYFVHTHAKKGTYPKHKDTQTPGNCLPAKHHTKEYAEEQASKNKRVHGFPFTLWTRAVK